jgi:hypothetical protein
VIALLVSFAYHTRAAHDADAGVNRQETEALIRPVVDDPRCNEPRSELRLGITYYNGLTDHNLVNELLVDLGQPAVQADRPSRRKVERPGRCVVNVFLEAVMVGPELWGHVDSALNERRATLLAQRVEYAVVLAPDASDLARGLALSRFYPHWADLSRHLLESGCWTPVGPARTISPWERALLLRRSCG